MKRTKLRKKSNKKKHIEKVLTLIRKINNIKYGNRCFFCGRTGDKWPLSNCHIKSVGSEPGLELVIENIVPACWSINHIYKRCHNLWECRDPKYRPIFEDMLKKEFGKDYFDNLAITAKAAPRMTGFQISAYEAYYKQMLVELQKELK